MANKFNVNHNNKTNIIFKKEKNCSFGIVFFLFDIFILSHIFGKCIKKGTKTVVFCANAVFWLCY